MVNIRPGTVADIPQITSLERQSETAGHWSDEQYRHVFQSGSSRLSLVAEAASAGESTNSEIVGFLIAHHVAPEWELENIVVAITARRKGIAALLLQTLFLAAKNTRSNSIFLEVRESNAAARELYARAGFEQTGRRKSYYTHPLEDAILYRRAP